MVEARPNVFIAVIKKWEVIETASLGSLFSYMALAFMQNFKD